MIKPDCLITAVNPDTGSSLASRFTENYQLAMITRDTERLARLEEETPASKGYPSDELDFTKLAAVQEEIKPTQGNPELVIHNPVSVAFGNLPSIDPRLLNRTFQVNTLALLYIAQSAAPEMM